LRSHDQDSLPAYARSPAHAAKPQNSEIVQSLHEDRVVGAQHGIVDADIEHAMEHAMTIEPQDDRRLLYLGFSRSGALLEVVKVVDSELVIHAMPAKATHARLLRG
jgi:hypothetical protein